MPCAARLRWSTRAAMPFSRSRSFVSAAQRARTASRSATRLRPAFSVSSLRAQAVGLDLARRAQDVGVVVALVAFPVREHGWRHPRRSLPAWPSPGRSPPPAAAARRRRARPAGRLRIPAPRRRPCASRPARRRSTGAPGRPPTRAHRRAAPGRPTRRRPCGGSRGPRRCARRRSRSRRGRQPRPWRCARRSGRSAFTLRWKMGMRGVFAGVGWCCSGFVAQRPHGVGAANS